MTDKIIGLFGININREELDFGGSERTPWNYDRPSESHSLEKLGKHENEVCLILGTGKPDREIATR
jgi:hypothetical protein